MLVNAIILINVERGQIDKVAQQIVEIDGVSDVFSVAGRYDLAVVIRAHSNEQVAEVVTKFIRSIPYIVGTETLMAFKAYSKSDIEAGFSIGNEEIAKKGG